jgi:predicted esterase
MINTLPNKHEHKMHRHVHLSLWAFAAILAPLPAARAANTAAFSDYSFRNAAGQVVLPGRLYIPPETIADPDAVRPLLVYLHGGGAIGTDNTTQILQTPDYMLEVAKERGAFLYVPQAPSGWASLSAIDAAMTMINRAVSQLHADSNRLYVAGYSNGGGGTWNLLSRNRGKFAAAFTLSAVAPASGFAAANLLDTAIFAIHARDDATVPVARSREVVNSILTAAGEPRPVYPPASSTQLFVLANPLSEYYREFLASVTPDIGTTFALSRSDTELLYYETPDGNHTGLLGLFYVPPIYDWMFDHSLIPEPNGALLATCSLVGLALARRPRRRRSRAPWPLP